MHIKKGDKVKIISGKDRGKTGKVVSVLPDKKRAVVEGANVYTRHERPKKQGEKGQKLDVFMPIHISNLQVIDPETKKPTRIKYTIDEKGLKKRASVKSDKIID